MATNGFVGFNASEGFVHDAERAFTERLQFGVPSLLRGRRRRHDDDDDDDDDDSFLWRLLVFNKCVLFFNSPIFLNTLIQFLDERVARLAARKMSNPSPPAPAPTPANRSPLNVEAKLFVPGVGMVTPPPKKNVIDELS